MNLIKNKNEICFLIEAGALLSDLFSLFSMNFFVGKKKIEIDHTIALLLEKRGLISQSRGYRGFSGYSCISVNHELVHGLPNDYVIKDCDLVKIDICASFKGYCVDMARMYYGDLYKEKYENVLNCGEESLAAGIASAIHGKRIGEIGNSINKVLQRYSYSVVTDFCGHGIGKLMHEPPNIPNYGKISDGICIKNGMVFAIEPMFCVGHSAALEIADDRWTAMSKYQYITGHIEDTMIVHENGPIVVTRIKI